MQWWEFTIVVVAAPIGALAVLYGMAWGADWLMRHGFDDD